MTAAPTWSILVPTLGERRALFERLMAGLLPQLDAHEGRVRVVAWHNNGRPSLPEIRQRLVLATETDYLSFVDDDDLVPSYFVDEAMTAISQRPDFVGWQTQCYSDGVPIGISFQSLKYGGWWNEKGRYFRDITHSNPIRTELARLADFRRARPGQAEDRLWVAQLRKTGRVRTEVVVDRIMYHYLHIPASSAWQRPSRIQAGDERSAINSRYFSWHTPSIKTGARA